MIAHPPSATLVLKEHIEKQIAQRNIEGNTVKDNDLVFNQEDGKPLLPDTISHAWVKLAR